MELLLVLSFAGVLACCHGYSLGAPLEQCVNMEPTGHGAPAQTSPAPYNISLSATSYKSGEMITVTVAVEDDDMYYEGFFIQARKSGSSEPIGTFSISGSDSEIKTMKCPQGKYDNNAVSHTGHEKKKVKSFMWTSQEGEDVNFRLTMVKSKVTYWTNVVTVKLSGDNSGASSASGLTLLLPALTMIAFVFKSK